MIRGMAKTISVTLAALFILTAFSGCADDAGAGAAPRGTAPPFGTFRDIPGVTEAEIKAIEDLQRANSAFEYGVLPTLEFFTKEDGEHGGYTALLCEWLTELFEIPFRPQLYQLDDLLEKLGGHTVDFAGSLSSAGELENTYMTDPIATRKGVMVRIKGSPGIAQISQTRLPRYAFLRGMASQRFAAEALEPGSYEAVPVENHLEAYEAIKNGDADAYIAQSVTEEFFSSYADVYIEDFFPLVFTSVYVFTAKPELEPVISVITKALRNGAEPYLNHLYEQGYKEYERNKFLKQLTGEELAYLQNTDTVPLAALYFDYPITFYNTYERRWEGAAFDLLNEVSRLTGFTFELVHDENTAPSELLAMLRDGRAHVFPDFDHTKERAEHFIWTEQILLSNQYALLSKWDHPNVTVNDISRARIGLPKDSSPAAMFRSWFPDAANTVEYESTDAAFLALDRGEVDLIMAGKNRLLSTGNFSSRSDYKANYLFDYYAESSFGLHKDQAVLCSIMDKALSIIDSDLILEQWMTKTYDYHTKMIEAQRPWLMGAIILVLIVLILILFVLYRSRGEGRRLGQLVEEKTKELELQTVTLTTMFDAIPDLIFTKDTDLRYTNYNKSMAEHFGFKQGDFDGHQSLASFGLSAELSERYNGLLRQVIRDGRTRTMEWPIPRFDGAETLFEGIHVPLVVNEQIIGVLGIARDITYRKKLETETKNASKAKSQFIANMSHEMRTPMNVVVGLTDLMLEEEVPDNIKENLKKINTAGNALMGLISDVLDISKIEAGRLELMPAQHDVASNINDIVTLNLIRIEDKPVTFKLDIDETMPRTLIGDELRIKQIMNNLLSNAFKYTHKGNVTLGVTSRRDGGDVWIDATISDTGIGIKKEDMAKLFTDYNQVDTRANRRIEGTGLGLSITKKLVELMDGEITAESEYGKGTVFRVRIRQGFVNDEVIGKETAKNLRGFRYSEKKTRAKLERPDLSYAKVLLVDDFPTNLDVAAGMLRKYKMQVDCVDNGQSAVDRVESGETVYDAVFMDHMMPEMDGVEATKRIRAIGTKYAKTVPIIALTANAVAGNEKMFLAKGFNAYLPKPINVMVLDSVVQRWVRDKSKE